jgi:hypothetical protein
MRSVALTAVSPMLLLLLPQESAAQSVMKYPPPPPPPPCKYVPDPETNPDVFYDLTPLQMMTEDIRIPGAGTGAWFVLRICQEPSRGPCTQSECSDCTVTTPSGVNTWVSGQGSTCGAIGNINAAHWGLQDPSNPYGGVQVNYTGGDPAGATQRTSTLRLMCEPSAIVPRGVSAIQVNPSSLEHYVITVAAADACVVRPKPMSWGWLTIIIGGSSLVVYAIGGAIINAKVRGEEGLNIIPQWWLWQQMPGLVRDGVVFSWKHGRVSAYNAPRRMREWWQGRGSQELREPIAAAAED